MNSDQDAWAGPVWSDCFVQSVLSGICQYLKIIFGVIWLNLNYRARHRGPYVDKQSFLRKKKTELKKKMFADQTCLYLHLKIMTDSDWIMWASCWRFQEEEDVNTFFYDIKSVTVERTNYSCCRPHCQGSRLGTPDVVRMSCCLLIPLYYS